MDKKDCKVVLIALFSLDIGVYALDAFLRSKGYSTQIIEFGHLKLPIEFTVNDYFTAKQLQHDLFPEPDLSLLCGLLKKTKPHLIGLSVSSSSYRTATWITRRLKEEFAVPVMWGGIHAIISPEECIKEADIVCTGEGEEAVYEVVELIRKNAEISGIRNTWIRRPTGIERNDMRPLIEDLNSLPPARRVNSKNKYLIDNGYIINNPVINAGYVLNSYPMMTSRGCLYSCSFCSNSIISKKYRGLGPYLRRRSVAHVIDEMQLAVQNTVIASFRFWDDVFTYDEDWLDEFCHMYLKKIGKPFICYGHPKHTKYRVLKKLANVGLSMLHVGIQTGSEIANKRLFKRRQTNTDIQGFSKDLISLQITPNFDLIVDNDFENSNDELQTVKLLLSLPKPYKILIFSMCFFPKTTLSNKAIAEDKIKETALEQHVSKALNNFFLFISASRNKHHLFWNCIKAMSVNNLFSPGVVRYAQDSKFFRRYPRILFLLCRCWLELFKQYGKKIQTGWLTPALMEKSYLNDYLVWPKSTQLYRPYANKQLVFLKTQDKQRQVVLRMNFGGNMGGKEQNIAGLQVEIIPLKEKDIRKKDVWRLMHPYILKGTQEIIFQEQYPDIYCFVSDNKRKMTLISAGMQLRQEAELCIMRVYTLLKGNFIPGKKNAVFRGFILLPVNGDGA